MYLTNSFYSFTPNHQDQVEASKPVQETKQDSRDQKAMRVEIQNAIEQGALVPEKLLIKPKDIPPSVTTRHLMLHHPGYDVRGCDLENTRIPKSILDWVQRWMNPLDQDASRIYIRTSKNDVQTQDLCSLVVEELTVMQGLLLFYNGLPRDGMSPADGWYTIPHMIWWLTVQMGIPVPHDDGHMPSTGYKPEPALLVDQLTEQGGMNYIVLYLPTRSCQNDLDSKLYHSLISGLCNIRSSHTRILLFSDGTDDAALGGFGPNRFSIDGLTHQEQVLLAEWNPTETIGDWGWKPERWSRSRRNQDRSKLPL